MTISLPGSSLCSRCHVLSARRSSPERAASVASCCSAPRFPREAGDGAIERGGGFRPVPVPRLPLDEIDDQLRRRRGGGAPAPRASRSLRLRCPSWSSSAIDAPSELDVARRRRQRGPRGRQRPFQIAERVAHPAQHVPFDGARRAFQLARQLGQRAAVARDRERERPDRAAALGIARRQLAQQRRERRSRPGRRRSDRGRPAAGARRAGPAPASRRRDRGGAAPPAPRRQRRACRRVPARPPGARRSRRCRVPCGPARAAARRSLSWAALSGASPERARMASAASMRRRRAGRAVLELQRIVVRGQRRGVVARVREGARSARERRDGLRRRPAGPDRTRRTRPSRHRAPAAGERTQRAARTPPCRRRPTHVRRARETARAASSDRRAPSA